jgi:putative iron-dependent peroxidase
MMNNQPGILEPIPDHGKYLFFDLLTDGNVTHSLRMLAELADGNDIVVGIGESLALRLGARVPGLKSFPVLTRAHIDIPSTQSSLMCWLRGTDQGDLFHQARRITALLAEGFVANDCIDTYKYGSGLDLTGYEDGTENPIDQAAVDAAIVSGKGPGLDGSSFVAMQQWLHNFDSFGAMSEIQADNSIGRRLKDNVELEDAPDSAHVKRTAQESFKPEAFMLRRSMPWSSTDTKGGLFFSAFGTSVNAFEAQLARMIGDEDGITDALFEFSRPVSGSYFWCPPLHEGRLDLRAISL